jgi:uncharacterized protein (TIGR02001 family)
MIDCLFGEFYHMKFVHSLSYAALFAVALPAIAVAADAVHPEWWGSVASSITLASDYSYRGISQTQLDPAVQGSIDWSNSKGFKAGVWASNLNYNDGGDASSEFDLYAGYMHDFGSVTLDVGGIQYFYPATTSSRNYDYVEAYAAGTYHITDTATTTVSLNYSPDYFGGSGASYYLRAAGVAPVAYGISLEGWVGNMWIQENATYGTPDYTDWMLGAAYDLKGYVLRAQYVDTDLSEAKCSGTNNCDGRGIVSVTHAF